MKQKRLLLLVLIISASIFAHAQTADYSWAQHFGKAGGSSASGTDLLATDKAGNVYVSGNCAGTGIVFGTTNITGIGAYNGFIAKLDPNGNAIWAKSTHLIQAGWDDDGNPDKIAIDSFGNVYLCGVFFSGANLDNVAISGDNNYFLARLDSMGNVLWIRTASTQVIYKSLNAVHINAQQQICMTGLYQNSIGFDLNFTLTNVSNPAGVDAFLTKYDTAGNVISATELGVINPVWSNQDYPHEQFQYDDQDNLYRFVTKNAVLAKYNENGILINTDTISATAGSLSIRSFAVDNNKNILFCGSFANGPLIIRNDTVYNNGANTDNDAILLKISATGSLLWHYHFTTLQGSNFYIMVRADDIGSVYALCREGSVLGISRIAVTKLSPDGNLTWNNYISNTNPPLFSISGYQFQPNTIVTAHHGGNILILGGFNGNTNPTAISPGYIFFNPLLNFTIAPNRGDIFIAQLGICNTLTPVITAVENGFCAGDSTLISASSSSQYLWSTNDTTSSIFVTNAGNYFEYAIEPLGCYARSDELQLDLYATSSDTVVTTNCNSYIFNGHTLLSSGVYIDSLVNTNGCDSIITLNLTINSINAGITQDSTTLTAQQSGAIYKWINCTNNASIANATNQSFTAVSNGTYALVITINNCTDSSACVLINSIAVTDSIENPTFSIYPNPTMGQFTVLLPTDSAFVTIINMLGQIIINKQATKKTMDFRLDTGGTYIVRVKTMQGTIAKKLVVIH